MLVSHQAIADQGSRMPSEQPSPEQQFEEVRAKLRNALEACHAMVMDYRAVFVDDSTTPAARRGAERKHSTRSDLERP
jgi:hypothetical protein